MPKAASLILEAEDFAPSANECEVRARLDQLIAELRKAGIPETVALRAIMGWAADRAYDSGGYGAAKALSLNALEEVLFRASC